MTSIIIASGNRVKVDAIRKAFEKFFDNVEAIGIEVESEVSRQPFDDEVFLGAKNRLENVKKLQTVADYYVSCEGGLVKIFGVYYNIHYVIIEDKHGNLSTGISQGYPIPEEYLDEIKETSIASVLDKIFNGEGGIRKLTNNEVTRDRIIYDSTIMALSGKMWSMKK